MVESVQGRPGIDRPKASGRNMTILTMAAPPELMVEDKFCHLWSHCGEFGFVSVTRAAVSLFKYCQFIELEVLIKGCQEVA